MFIQLKPLYWFLFIGWLLCPELVQGQSDFFQRRFKASFFLGLHASQMDGDKQRGYSKFGPFGGLRGILRLDRQNELGLDLYFSQRGARSDRIGTDFGGRLPLNVTLNYTQVGLHYLYLFQKKKTGFYRWNLEAGLVYGRLLSSEVQEAPALGVNLFEVAEVESDFTKNALDVAVGVSYFVTDKIGLSVRHSIELVPLYKNRGTTDELIARLLQYYFSFGVLFVFK